MSLSSQVFIPPAAKSDFNVVRGWLKHTTETVGGYAEMSVFSILKTRNCVSSETLA